MSDDKNSSKPAEDAPESISDGVQEYTPDGVKDTSQDDTPQDTPVESIGPSLDEDHKPQDHSQNITMKKSAYHGLVITAIVGIAIGTFFAGYFVAYTSIGPDMDTSQFVTISQLQGILSQIPNAPTAPTRVMVSIDDDPVLGNPNAPITIIEFSDFECPFCARFYDQTLPPLKENFVEQGLVKMVYRDFPLDNIHPNATITHVAAECAHDQDKFWQYHDILFEEQSTWNDQSSTQIQNTLVEYAESLSMDVDSFETCMNDPAVLAEIEADKRAGSQHGVSGTPAFFIGNDELGYELVSGAKPYSEFVRIIGQYLDT